MRLLLVCVVLTALLSCNSRNETTEDLSDTLDVDTIIVIPDVDVDTMAASRSDLEPLQLALEELTQSQVDNSGTTYRLELSASGYEYQTDATWFFDSLYNLVGCTQRWASEGMEGNSNHFFKLEKLFAFVKNDAYDTRTDVTLFHREMGGFSYTQNDGLATDSTMRAIDPNVLSQEEADIRKQLKDVVNSLRENEEQIADSEEGLLLELKNEVKYGEETFSETSQISLDKKLLDKLLE
jgi:hypothetical protein